MNTSPVFVAATLLAGAAVLPPASASAEPCDPRILESPTTFPMGSQRRGQKGLVVLKVAVDEHGRVEDMKVIESSGYRLLDRAAERAVREDWRFDVSSCVRKDLPAQDVVAVEFRNGEYGG